MEVTVAKSKTPLPDGAPKAQEVRKGAGSPRFPSSKISGRRGDEVMRGCSLPTSRILASQGSRRFSETMLIFRVRVGGS
jgi:hypothetical protein